MSDILSIIAPWVALAGGLTLFVALFTPKRFTAKRPARFRNGTALLVLSAVLWYLASR